MRPFLRAPVLLFLALLAGACGPVEYINQVTRRASEQLAAARESGAEKTAPYEYTSAVEYLHKAREEAGYADYQAAIRFGRIAAEMAANARKIALRVAAEDDGAERQSSAAEDK